MWRVSLSDIRCAGKEARMRLVQKEKGGAVQFGVGEDSDKITHARTTSSAGRKKYVRIRSLEECDESVSEVAAEMHRSEIGKYVLRNVLTSTYRKNG